MKLKERLLSKRMKIHKGKWWISFEIERYPTTLISFGANIPAELFEKIDKENKRRLAEKIIE